MKCYSSFLVLVFFVNSVICDRMFGACPAVKLKNGRIRSRQRGRFLKFICNPGYSLAGERISICANGKWDIPAPKCVRATCQTKKDPPANGIILPSHGGGVLNFYCKPGFELRGPSAVFCEGVKWDDNAPTCLTTRTKPKLFCDFEEADICSWSHDLNHDFDWVRDSYKTPSGYSIQTGPSHDHTKGDGQNGHYMYVESSSRRPNDTARLISPIFNSTRTNACLEFFYHMYGSTTGGLRVYVKKVKEIWNLDPKTAIFTKFGNQGDTWYRSFSNLGIVDDDYQIIMEGIRGGGYTGDTAIDDVKILENCVYEDHIYVTTEEPAVSDVLKIVESCDSRCGHKATGNEGSQIIACDCDDNCFETNRCCPDYIDFCFISTSTVDYETTMDLIIQNSTAQRTKLPETNMHTLTKIPEINAVVSTTYKPIVHTQINRSFPISTKKIVYPPKLNTLRPLILLTQPTTRKIVQKIIPKPLKPNVTSSKITFLKSKPTNPPLFDVKTNDVIEVPSKQNMDEELLLSTPLSDEDNLSAFLDKEDYAEKISNEKRRPLKELFNDPYLPENLGESHKEFSQSQTDYSNTKMVFIVVASCCAVAVLVIVSVLVLVKYRVVRCKGRKMTSGSGDSQSDVRFLTADEVLDFSLDKQYDDL